MAGWYWADRVPWFHSQKLHSLVVSHAAQHSAVPSMRLAVVKFRSKLSVLYADAVQAPRAMPLAHCKEVK